jgi:hypothetical protein
MNIPGCKDGWRVQLLWMFVAWPGGVSTRYIFLLDIQRPVIVYMRVDDSRPDVSFSIFLGLNVMVRLKIICLISRYHDATPLRMLMFLAPRQKLNAPARFPHKTMRNTGTSSIAGKLFWDPRLDDALFPELYSVIGKSISIAKGGTSMAGFRGLHSPLFEVKKAIKPLLWMNNICRAGKLKREGTKLPWARPSRNS